MLLRAGDLTCSCWLYFINVWFCMLNRWISRVLSPLYDKLLSPLYDKLIVLHVAHPLPMVVTLPFFIAIALFLTMAFHYTQVDSTCMFNLEGFIPKLCQLAQEFGDNDRALRLRAAGLQALASMVPYSFICINGCNYDLKIPWHWIYWEFYFQVLLFSFHLQIAALVSLYLKSFSKLLQLLVETVHFFVIGFILWELKRHYLVERFYPSPLSECLYLANFTKDAAFIRTDSFSKSNGMAIQGNWKVFSH